MWECLLLVMFVFGTRTGIKYVPDGDRGRSEAALRHMRLRCLTEEDLRRAITQSAYDQARDHFPV